ncbi:NAD(P)/FAD-dependent oxidoreductase [Kitasatospora sp. GP82]|uniref:phytoene desaturase family protein n=1 Tax=Kitasatospora sp. GP82 TaxID=3035089 RepID=UPI002476F106|nr:NAD(P)/FAD-dependent oxidoreductase [Kitasatospora sp. GP82]MDH6125233.1 all-trans-retinol 13,14-reductase [Kitasatospora sp. GP82]
MAGEDRWDAVVIGSGVGGLVCAAYLAVAGRRVLVLEQAPVAGGNSHVFRRRRAYEFDVGLHYLGDCGPDGLLPAVLGGLGLRERLDFLPMDQDGFDRIALPGVTVDVPADPEEYRRRLVAALPRDAAGITGALEVITGLGRERRDAITAAADIPMAELPERSPHTVSWGQRLLGELFDHFGLSAPARTALAALSPNYGLGPEQAPVATHATMTDHYLRGAYYLKGGGQQLAGSLLEVIRAYGGELRTRSRVERILVDGRRVTGVGLADGSTVPSELVVSNADYRRTVLELVGAEHFPRKLVAKTRDSVMALPFATVYVALDTGLSDRPNANLWWYRGDDITSYYRQLAADELYPVPFVFASYASLKDPHSRQVCPPGHSNFQLMTLCPPGTARWGVADGPSREGSYRRQEAYLAEKKRFTEAVLDAAEEAMGPFRSRITHLETATPLTQKRYTRSTGGTPFGLAEWGGPGSRPPTRTFIEGLHVVGTNTRYGTGITGAAVSGIACAAQINGERLVHQVHSGRVLGDPARLPDRPADWDALAFSR